MVCKIFSKFILSLCLLRLIVTTYSNYQDIANTSLTPSMDLLHTDDFLLFDTNIVNSTQDNINIETCSDKEFEQNDSKVDPTALENKHDSDCSFSKSKQNKKEYTNRSKRKKTVDNINVIKHNKIQRTDYPSTLTNINQQNNDYTARTLMKSEKLCSTNTQSIFGQPQHQNNDITHDHETIIKLAKIPLVINKENNKKKQLDNLRHVVCSILFQRQNICTFFTFFRNNNSFRQIDNTSYLQVLSQITYTCVQFSEMCHDELIKIQREPVKNVNLNQLLNDEQRLTHETNSLKEQGKAMLYKSSLLRIRAYNTLVIDIKKHYLYKNTEFIYLKNMLQSILGTSFITETFLDTLLSFLKPLYKLSLDFDKEQNKLLHNMLANSSHIYTNRCPYNKNIKKHHLFNWAFYWMFSIANFDLFQYFNCTRFTKIQFNTIPIDFIAQLIILICSFDSLEQENNTLYIDNELLLETWKKNIVYELLLNSIFNKDTVLVKTIKKLLYEISDYQAQKLVIDHYYCDLRLLRIGQDIQSPSYLSHLMLFYIKKAKMIGEKAYLDTKKQLYN